MSNVRAVDGNFDFVKWYYSPYISSYLFLDNGTSIAPYLNLGAKYYFLPDGPKELTGYYKYEPTSENLIMTAHYAESFVGAFVELGLRLGHPENKTQWLVGLRYNYSSTIMWGNYKNVTDNTVNYSDQTSATGSSLGLVIRASGLLIPSKTNIYAKHRKHKNKKTSRRRIPAKVRKEPVQKHAPNSLDNH